MRFILLKSVIDIRINLNKDKRFASAKFSRRQYSLRTSGEELEIFLNIHPYIGHLVESVTNVTTRIFIKLRDTVMS